MLQDRAPREERTDAGQRRATLGVLVDWLEDDYQNTILAGIADAAIERDVNLLCFAGGILEDRGRGVQRNAIYELAGPENVDGLMILSGALANVVGTSQLARFLERYRPLPMCGIAVALPGMPSVLVDNATGMRQALLHLLDDHGHRRIAFVRGPEANEEAERRYGVYRDVLAERGLSIDDALVTAGDFHQPSGVRAAELLLERGVVFDALFAASDYMALGAIEALSARGLRVPEDVAVVGFDDVDEARYALPPLTTVRQPLYEQGRRALELLLALVRGEAVPERERLHTELVRRGSCRCRSPSFLPQAASPDAHEALEQALRAQARQRIGVQRWARALSATGEVLLTSFDLRALEGVVAEQFPRLQIESCFVSLYKDGSRPAHRSRLILGYDSRSEPGHGSRQRGFYSRQLLPPGMWPAERRFSYVIQPLFFETEQLGFALFEMGPREGAIYEALRDQISGALKGALLVQQVVDKDHQRQRLLRYIVDVTPDMHRIQPLADLYQGILSEVTGLLSAVEAGPASSADGSLPPPPPQVEGFLAVAAEDQELRICAATPRFEGASHIAECLDEATLSSVSRALESGVLQVGSSSTIVPLRVGELSIGVLYLDRSVSLAEDVELLEILSNQASAAIQNMQLYEMAALDPLTGVHARRFFDEWLYKEVKIAFRSQQPLSIVMIDLDNMKAINDTAGHLAGDQALATMGRILRRVTRDNDVVGRYGGDEFALILPQTTADAATRAAKRILELLADTVVALPTGGRLPLRSSLGQCTLEPHSLSPSELPSRLPASYVHDVARALVQKADEALYRAKRGGRAQLQVGDVVRWQTLESLRNEDNTP